MTAAAARHLPEFVTDRRAPPPDYPGRLQPLHGAGDGPDARLAEAMERGRREGYETAQVAQVAERAAAAAAFEARLAAERERLVAEAGDRLAAGLAAGIEEIRTGLAGHVAKVLLPFLETALRRRAVDELGETVLALLGSGPHLSLAIRAPEDLIDALRLRLAAWPGARFGVGEGADIRVAVDDTIIETRIADWGARLAAALAGEGHG